MPPTSASASATAPAPAHRARLDGLDALRGLAALLVTLMHVLHLAKWDNPLNRAYLAVDLFFMLSGYVIARTYEARFAQGVAPWRFGWQRLARLWPTMALGAVLGLVCFWNRLPLATSLTWFGMALLLLPSSRRVDPVFPANPPAWSIVYELFANAVHVVALRHIGVRGLLAVAAVAGAGLLAFAPNLNVGNLPGEHWLAMARVLVSYAIGMAVWRSVGERVLLPAWVWLAAMPAAILLAGLTPPDSRWQDFAFVFALCPLLLLSGLAPLPFARRALVWLGTISFPLYAVHFPIVLMARRAGLHPGAGLALALGAAWLVAEITARRLPAGWWRRPAAA